MSHDARAVCICQKNHYPSPLELEHHHIWPKGLGGTDDPSNLVWICPTTHTNAHEILRLFMRNGLMSFYELGELYDTPVSKYAYQLAKEGYIRWWTGTNGSFFAP